MPSPLLCPVCRCPLVRSERVFSCDGRHSFDIARSGYVNLMAGKPPAVGDNREMIAARRRFLDGGHYAPLRRHILEVADEHAEGGLLLDAGCGEGYYTEALAPLADTAVGIDISKDALTLAARRLPAATLAVASVYRLPIADGAVSLLSCIFAPLAAEEYQRVLRRGGLFLYTIPARRHLFEMKSILYDNPYENQPVAYDLDGFTLVDRREVDFHVILNSKEEIADLFAMTPYFYRTPRAGRERLAALDRLEVGASFEVLAYRRG